MSTQRKPLPADAYRDKILPERERAAVRNRWLMERLENYVPQLMEREGFDMWIIAAREYNEDPVIMALLPEPMMAARRRTILVFARRPDGTVERLTISRYGLGEYYRAVWDPEQEEQWDCLARIVRERDPQVIGINVSETHAFGDGLTHGEFLGMAAALGETYMARTRGAERLCVGYLEHRTQAEIATYPGIVEIAHAIVAEAFSSKVILPGVTTTDDVVWWMRQKVTDLGLRTWFQPSVSIQAPDLAPAPMGGQPRKREPGGDSGVPVKPAADRKLIQPGDLLHCDFGIIYLGLYTDTQEDAYVLRLGETDAPQGLHAAMAAGNRLQDIHLEMMVTGRTGNEILSRALAKAKAEGLRPTIYTHPLGYHGHAAGPTIGLWDQQGGVPGRGDYELFEQTGHSIELNVKHEVPEWNGQEVRMALEQDIIYVGEGQSVWLDGRQTRLHLIG
jgi:Xaa-Pro aminopeptidase